jgi:hypothetical protein
MFGFMNVIFGILLIGSGIAVIIIRAGNYQVGAGVWSGTFSTCAGLVALMTGTKRKKVVIGCVAMTSFAIITVFAAGIVAGTGIQQDEGIMATQSDKSKMMKAKIGLNAVTAALCVVIFFASIFIVYLCGKALDDAAYAKDVDVNKLYPSQLSRTSLDGITNPVYIEEQTRGVANGSVRLLDPKQPILLVPLKEKQMDTLNISYDLTDGHNQTCRIVRYNSSESIPWDRSVSREDLAHTGNQPDNQLQSYSRNESSWCREVPVDIESQEPGNVHRQRTNDWSDDSGYIVLDTVDAKKEAGYGISPESYRKSEGESEGEYEHPSLSHWNTLASLEMGSESSLGFSDIVKMTPESGSPQLSRPDEKPPPPYEQDEEELRTFSKEFVENICQAAFDEIFSELGVEGNGQEQIKNNDSASRGQSGTCNDLGIITRGGSAEIINSGTCKYYETTGSRGGSAEIINSGTCKYNETTGSRGGSAEIINSASGTCKHNETSRRGSAEMISGKYNETTGSRRGSAEIISCSKAGEITGHSGASGAVINSGEHSVTAGNRRISEEIQNTCSSNSVSMTYGNGLETSIQNSDTDLHHRIDTCQVAQSSSGDKKELEGSVNVKGGRVAVETDLDASASGGSVQMQGTRDSEGDGRTDLQNESSVQLNAMSQHAHIMNSSSDLGSSGSGSSQAQLKVSQQEMVPVKTLADVKDAKPESTKEELGGEGDMKTKLFENLSTGN